MNTLMSQLHDIEGLDNISMWPLAIGWWMVMALGVVIFSGVAWFLAHKLAFKRSWKNDTLQKLARLEKNLSDETAQETAVILSEYLRRIALRTHPRKECAGLVGEAWLKWLTDHDPREFDWEKEGKLLIDSPYAPAHKNLSVSRLKELIKASRYWVR